MLSHKKKSKIVWFTGMSGAGKSYYSKFMEEKLNKYNKTVNLIDGDIIRDKYKIKVGFDYNEICDNNRNIAKLCDKEYKKYDITIVSVISPYELIRQEIKNIFEDDFLLIYVYSDINSLKDRDTKGLYRKADMGLIDNLIGYSKKSVYEPPVNPDLTLDTSNNINPSENIKLLNYFMDKNIL